MQALAHRQDALAHRRHFGLPPRAQRRVGEHAGDDAGGVDRRARVVAAHGGLQLAEHELGFGGVGADDAQSPGAFAIHAHALRERVGDDERHALIGHPPHRVRVFFDAVAVALVGEVEVGQQLPLDQQRHEPVPLRARQIDAGRVVAAGVQQDDASRRQGAQRLAHRIEAQAAGVRVVIRVGVDSDAGAFEHRAVVVPGRVADPDGAVGQPALDEVGADLQAAARTDGLQRGDAAIPDRRMPGAEQQRLHRAPHRRIAFDRQVALGAARSEHLRLGIAHAGQHRNAAVVVEVDADRQVDLVRPRVFLEGLVEAQDRVAGVGLEMLENAHAASAASMSARSFSGSSFGA